ncbi:MAG: MBL fold metallo-hydrolase [Alphaproteobacteria bacterium]|nr:MBL fold metallo-hydrolase [Alphaproteobacteria bacterium]
MGVLLTALQRSLGARATGQLALGTLAFAAVCLIVAMSPVRAETRFRVTLLGTGTPLASATRFGPSTLVEAGDQILLFDAGRGVPIRLAQLHIPSAKINLLFLTHYHSDHTSGIADIWLTGWTTGGGGRKAPFQVIGPTGADALMRNLEKAYAKDVEIRELDENLPPEGAKIDVKEFDSDTVVYEKNGVRVTAFSVDHGPKIKPSYGYRIDYGGHAAVISGDTRFSPNLIRHAAGADLVVHEVMADPVGPLTPALKAIMDHHSSPRDAGRVFDAVKPKLAAYTHIIAPDDPAAADQLIKATRETYSGPLEVGADLTSFDIGNTVIVHHGAP